MKFGSGSVRLTHYLKFWFVWKRPASAYGIRLSAKAGLRKSLTRSPPFLLS